MSVPEVEADDLAAAFVEVPDSNVEHFFVKADPSDPTAADEIVGLEVDGVESITRFLILPNSCCKG